MGMEALVGAIDCTQVKVTAEHRVAFSSCEFVLRMHRLQAKASKDLSDPESFRQRALIANLWGDSRNDCCLRHHGASICRDRTR